MVCDVGTDVMVSGDVGIDVDGGEVNVDGEVVVGTSSDDVMVSDDVIVSDDVMVCDVDGGEVDGGEVDGGDSDFHNLTRSSNIFIRSVNLSPDSEAKVANCCPTLIAFLKLLFDCDEDGFSLPGWNIL